MIDNDIRDEPIDWLKVIIHFICGAILGAFLGLWLWVQTKQLESINLGLSMIGGCALALGIASAVFMDRFWTGIMDLFR